MSRHLVGERLQPVADLNLPLLIAVVEQDQRMTSIGIFESSIGYPCFDSEVAIRTAPGFTTAER